MSLLALLAALLAQHARPVSGRQPLLAFYGRMCLSAAKRLNAGDRNSGILAWLALMGAVLVPVALVSRSPPRSTWSLLWVLEVAFLYATLRFFATTSQPRRDRAGAARGRHGRGAASLLGTWRGEPIETDDAGRDRALAAEHGLREAHQGTFAPLFWYLVLPGPARPRALSARAARRAQLGARGRARGARLRLVRRAAFRVIDWVPQRVSAFVFAVAGNFEDALYCWRSQAAQWMRPEEGIVLASGAGALGVKLGGLGTGRGGARGRAGEPRGAALARAGRLADRLPAGRGDPRRVAGVVS